MLKKRMATEIVVIALALGIALLFPACNKNKSGKESYDYSKILKGDLSEFVGTYVDGRGYKLELKADGSYKDYFIGLNFSFDEDSGTYRLSLSSSQDSFSMFLFPVGVDAYNNDGKLVKTDKTKIRLHSNNPHPSSSDDLYYWESSKITASVNNEPEPASPVDNSLQAPKQFDRIWYATSNLSFRMEPDTSKDNVITNVTKGTKFELLEIGKEETIDGITAPWYNVTTDYGTSGWLFSGYLSATDPSAPGSYDYTKLLKGDFSDFTGSWSNGDGQKRRLRRSGTFDRGQTANGFTRQNNPKQASGGDFYMWGVNSEGGGFAVALFPVGVDVMGYEGIIPTDKTKVRLTMGQDLPSSNKEVFYQE
jgi:hypothetical protein